ncbi:hypothetical protein GQ44DRAFT_710720 [Phaeosphaeriaceae sp. PMI808]|nr:hypothetical protein GQ44DRAFT_710720 [Phaeosphaeriaceae sp. PMI808]
MQMRWRLLALQGMFWVTSKPLVCTLQPKVNERDVFVQERIPGVGLKIAWQYLSQPQKSSFKQQAQEILQTLRTTIPTAKISADRTSSQIQIPLNIGVFKSLKETLSLQRTMKTPTFASCTTISRCQIASLIRIKLWDLPIGRWLGSSAGKLRRMFMFRYELQNVRILLRLIWQRTN